MFEGLKAEDYFYLFSTLSLIHGPTVTLYIQIIAYAFFLLLNFGHNQTSEFAI